MPVEGIEPPTHGLQNRCSTIWAKQAVGIIANTEFLIGWEYTISW